jgi:hypothetical protein
MKLKIIVLTNYILKKIINKKFKTMVHDDSKLNKYNNYNKNNYNSKDIEIIHIDSLLQ